MMREKCNENRCRSFDTKYDNNCGVYEAEDFMKCTMFNKNLPNVAKPASFSPLLSDVRKQCIGKYFTPVERIDLRNGNYYLIDGKWYEPLFGCDTIQDMLDDLFAHIR